MGPSRRWIVTTAERLGLLLEREGALDALGDGRVFVDGRRTTSAALELTPGVRVELYPGRSERPAPRILQEFDGLVVVDKPAGIATEPERRGARDVVTQQIASQLGLPAASVHALSRLDLGVSGIVLLGVTQAARRRVVELRARGRVRRRYLAIAGSAPEPAIGVWSDRLRRAAGGPKRRSAPDGKPARTHFRVTGLAAGVAGAAACALALEPASGRTHQLRAHASEHGAPLWGDATYGGPRQLVLPDGAVRALDRVFLHACWLELDGAPRIQAPLPPEFESLWEAAGGSASALARAMNDELSD
jgi:23S rRNA pseudouridine1911/1915/1917 synthase